MTDIELTKPAFQTHQLEQPDQKWKPSKPLLIATCALFVILGIFDVLGFDVIFAKGEAENWGLPDCNFHIGTIFFFDAWGRLLISVGALLMMKQLSATVKNFSALEYLDYARVFFFRFILQLGFLIGALAIEGLGGGTVKVFQQTQLAFVCVFRWVCLGKKPLAQQAIHAFGVVMLAITFKLDDFEAKGKNSSDLIQGAVLCAISIFVVSFMFTVMEYILKDRLDHVQQWDKQLLFAMADIPSMVVCCLLDSVWKIYIIENAKGQTFNFLENMDWVLAFMAVVCTLFGLVMWCLFDWVDSMFVNLLLVLVMAVSWPIEVAVGFEKPNNVATKACILVAIIAACVGYQVESMLDSERKEKIEKLQETP